MAAALVGGRFIVPAFRADSGEAAFREALSLAPAPERGGIGPAGFLVFGGDRETLPARLRAIACAAERPLLFFADLERGAGQQVRGLTRLPHLMALGAAAEPELAYRAGCLTAREARACGLHAAFAPVVDLATRPENPIINHRAFGDDPVAVAGLAAAWVRGCRAGGALSCAKHFPGHGDTAVDSHIALPRAETPLDLLEARELVPYRVLAAEGVDMVMTAHIAVASLTGEPDLPVTLGARAIDYLRREIGFCGIVVTDALRMGGITSFCGEAEAAIRALEAGCDLILDPSDPREVGRAVGSALESGRIPIARALEAERRIGRAAALAGAHAPPLEAPSPREADGPELADEIARRALVRYREGEAPRLGGEPPGLLVVLSGDPGEAGGVLAAEVHRLAPRVRIFPVGTDSPAERLATILAAARARAAAEPLVAALFSKVAAWKGGCGLLEREERFLGDLMRAGPTPGAAVSCGSPYLLAAARGAAFRGCAFSDEAPSQRAVAYALCGAPGFAFTARSPVRWEPPA